MIVFLLFNSFYASLPYLSLVMLALSLPVVLFYVLACLVIFFLDSQA